MEMRVEDSSRIFPVSCILKSGEFEVRTSLINYHYRGACIRIPEDFEKCLSEKFSIDVYWGNKLIWEKIDFRIAWKSSVPDLMIGVEFLNESGTWFQRPERFLAHPQFRPVLSVADPLNLNRVILFQILNISEGGLLLSTSLTNKHLLKGMPLKSCRIQFPGEEPVSVDVVIKNTRRSAQAGFFELGVSLESAPPVYSQTAKRYVSALSPVAVPQERLELLSKEGMLSRTIKSSLSFRTIEDQKTYENLLRLRYLGYAAHGKIKEGSGWQDQGEGLHNEGMIVGAFLGSELVASMEMRFGNSHLPFRVTSLFDSETLAKLNFDKLCEVNKLVIHPEAQGSDILIGMIQTCHSLLIANGGLDVIITATDKLIPIYRRIGFQKLGHSIPHPVLENTRLHLMLMKSEAYMKAKKIHIFYWAMVMRQTQDQMAELGMSDRVMLTLWQRIVISAFGVIHKYQRKRRSRRWDREHRRRKAALPRKN